MQQTNVVLIDNFDSFSYNLVDELRVMGMSLTVFRNTVPTAKVMNKLRTAQQQSLLLLSPGPGDPASAGNLLDILSASQGRYPVLGICLGHQAIVQHYGGQIVRAPAVVHGKASLLNHCGDKMFSSLPNPLPVARYHSLMATALPPELRTLAEFDAIPMAVHHPQDQMLGFQFHPESILTSTGSQLLRQSIAFLTRSAL